MVNKVMRLLNTTYGNKKVQALNKTCDYYNDGLYKKIRNKTINFKYCEMLNIKNKKNEKLEVKENKEKIFARDLINKQFKLLDLEKKRVVNLKVINDEKQNYEKGIINTTAPLVQCLINKKVNDIILIGSMDNRKSLTTEYKILEIN